MKSSVSPASDASRAVSTSTSPACGVTLGRGCRRRAAGLGRGAGLGVGVEVGAVCGSVSRLRLRGTRAGASISGVGSFRRLSLLILRLMTPAKPSLFTLSNKFPLC